MDNQPCVRSILINRSTPRGAITSFPLIDTAWRLLLPLLLLSCSFIPNNASAPEESIASASDQIDDNVNAVNYTINPERDALIKLKASLGLYNPSISSVLFDWAAPGGSEDCCDWTRVRCDDQSNVIYLDLRQAGLRGPLPSGFSAFANLSRLYLSLNNFSGSIEEDLSRCTHLEILDLSSNILSTSLLESSAIPLHLGNLHKLRYLDLSSNLLAGPINYSIFANWTTLLHLNLSNNNLVGSLSSQLFYSCSSLRVMDLSNNYLNGTLPEQISLGGAMSMVQDLRLNNNRFNGHIPPSLFDPCGSNLQRLDLSFNSFWGTIPPSLGNCSALKVLSLSRNYLVSFIPHQLGNLMQLQSLVLGDNYLSGGLPYELSSLKSLAYLDLKRNALSGNLPSFLAENSALQYLWLNSNNFSGSLTKEFLQNLTLLRYLDLSDNHLVSFIPLEVAKLESLQFLFMSGNRFTGDIPPQLGDMEGLQMLDLSYNLLNGSIPPTLGQLKNLLWLNIAGNNLNGVLPDGLGNCTSLLWFNAADNGLTGELPGKIGMMGGGAATTFDENEGGQPWMPGYAGDCSIFGRWLPEGYRNGATLFSSLTDYEGCASLWNKLVEGSLSLGSSGSACSKLRFTTSGYLLLSNNKVQGSIPASVGDSVLLSILSLDGNQLAGAIPSSLSALPLTYLNLSHNHLSGLLASSGIANLTCLTALDLSSNNFTGSLPVDLQNLSQLSSFNVSYNPGLEGVIPAGGRLATFGSQSYLGNTNLCFEQLPAGEADPALIDAASPRACGRGNAPQDEQGNQKQAGVNIPPPFVKAHAAAATVGAAAAVLVIAAVSAAAWRRRDPVARRKHAGGGDDVDFLLGKPPSSKRAAPALTWTTDMFYPGRRDAVSYEDLDWATRGFHERFAVGGRGAVFKADFGSGVVVAVKRLHVDRDLGAGFRAQLRQLAGLRHPHLVPLVGCLHRGPHHLLLLPFMHHGSLHEWLHVRPDGPATLDWSRRLGIASGAASALTWLHGRGLVHGNVKPQNVLLDQRFRAHVADCHMAHVSRRDQWLGSSDTPPYAPPELDPVVNDARTVEGDVYSFGVILLELTTRECLAGTMDQKLAVPCGNRIQSIRTTLQQHSRAEHLLDTALCGSCADIRAAVRMLELGHACTHTIPSNRPSMDDVAHTLSELHSVEEHRLPCIFASSA